MPISSVWKARLRDKAIELGPHDSNNEPCRHAIEFLRLCTDCGKLDCIECGAKNLACKPLNRFETLTEWVCMRCQDDLCPTDEDYIRFGMHEDAAFEADHDEPELDHTDYEGIGEGLTINEPPCKHCGQAYTDCSCEEYEAKA